MTAFYIFNALPADGERPAVLRERIADRLRSGSWDLGADEPHRDALAPGDRVLLYLGAPDRALVGRAELDGTADGIALTQVEEWDPPVPMSAVLARIDRSGGARADFETGVVQITATEYETAVAVAHERRPVTGSLIRWTAFSEHWDEDVGCVSVETGDGLVFIDPLAPSPELGAPDHTLVTVFFHARDARGRVWAPRRLVRRLGNRGVVVTDPFDPGDPLPGGILCFATARDGEYLYWLPEQRAVVIGDVLLGAGAKPRATDDPLRLCPARWVAPATLDELRESLRPLLDLPVEQVLVSHGAPVLEGAAGALAEVLA